MGMKPTSDPDIQLVDDDLDEDLDIDASDDDKDDGEPEDRGDVVTPADDEPAPLDPKAVKKLAAQAADDDEGDELAGKSAGKPVIPKERFDEVNEALKESRRVNEALAEALRARGGTPPAAAAPAADAPKPVDLDALEAQYADALMDGDLAKATGIRKQIRDEEKRQAKEEALAEMSAAEERKLFADAVKDAQAAYPQLNHKDPQADKAAINDVVKWRDFLVASEDLPLHIALRDAVQTVASARGWEKAGADKKDPTPTPSNRAEEQRRKNAVAANAQPAQLNGGVGERAGRARQLDVETMSDKEFAALSDEEKKALRGDVA